MRPTPSWPNSCRPLAWGSACHPEPDTLSVQQHCAFNYSPSYRYSCTEMSCWNIKPYIHPNIFITGQYCGRLLKFSAHSLNVLGIRYKVFKYVFLLIISYIHIYKTIFQICFFIDDIIYTYIQDHIEMR